MQTSTAVSEALAVQRLISSELLKQKTMPEKLKKILKAFVELTASKSALLYVTADENYLELIGEWQAENYKSNIRYNEDCIGRSAASKRVTAETDEAQNVTVLSIPVTRLSVVIGALVLLKKGNDAFSEAEAEKAAPSGTPRTGSRSRARKASGKGTGAASENKPKITRKKTKKVAPKVSGASAENKPAGAKKPARRGTAAKKTGTKKTTAPRTPAHGNNAR